MSNIADRFVVVLDTNVLYPFGVRDALLCFADAGLYRARWTSDILDEMVEAIARTRPDLQDRILRTREIMERKFEEALIDGYDGLVPALTLPDEDDCHVLAAAIQSGAQLIVTENRRDFPAESLEPYDIETMTADEFLVSTFELYVTPAVSALREMRARYKSPAYGPSEFLFHLQRIGLAKLASVLKPHIDLI